MSSKRARKTCVADNGLRLLLVLVLLHTSVMGWTSESAANKTVAFDIPQQRADHALTEFAEQADLTLIFPPEMVGGIAANELIGTYTQEEGAEILLEGTGLSPTFSNRVVLSIATDDTSTNEGEEMDIERNSGLAAFLAAVFSVGANAQEPADTDESEQVLEEIVVVGTHIRGVEKVGATSITFSREEIAKTGFSTIEELFQSLPQNLDEISADGGLADGTSQVAGANSQGATSISLRGLGPGSTLVLLNGKRRPGNIRGRAVDVSAIPLSMIESVEVVTGGGSAVYGSDAVAGVVNIVTRTELNGAESQVYYGESPGGGERLNFNQTFGREFDEGGFVLGYDYRKDQKLDLTDTGVVRAPSIAGRTPVPGLYYLRYPSEQHVALLAGHLNLTDKAEIYGDAQFSFDKNEGGQAFAGSSGATDFQSAQIIVTDSDQYSAVAGVRLDVGKDWQIDVSALHGIVDNTSFGVNPFAIAPDTITSFAVPPERQDEDEAKLSSFSAIADGPLGKFGGGIISAAMGMEFRGESYERIRTDLLTGTMTQGESRDRDISSIFGEIHLPLISRNGQRLEVSLAGRYDDYSDFGGTFNPLLGVDWEPVSGLTFRGSYSEAFRAPDLFSLDLANQILISGIPDPLAPGGTSIALGEFGGNPLLQPEEADTWTVGIDWEPSDRSRLSLSYFNIEYDDRIDAPSVGLLTVLQDESVLSDLINRSPTSAEVIEIFDRTDLNTFLDFTSPSVPFDPTTDDPLTFYPGLILFDGRVSNIALEELDGIDLQALTVSETESGDWTFGLNGTYYFDFERKITAAAPAVDQLNQPGKTIELKLRGNIGWSKSAWNVSAFVNYVDNYEDINAATPTDIDSWTTVDLIFGFDASKITDGGVPNGVKVTLAINNAFDEDPPVYLSHLSGLGFDAANADAIGRFVSLRIAKRW